MKIRTSLLLAALAAAGSSQAGNWSAPQQPFPIHGNTYYVGTAGISALLLTSPQGHVLIDGATEKGGELIAANIRALGFRLEDVRYILSTHAHHDHAGGIAGLQRLSDAEVLAGAGNVEALRTGKPSKEDPQYGNLSDMPAAAKVRAVADGETVKLGPLTVKAHSTPGHTPGGVSWTWQSCEAGACQQLVFADSLTAVSADEYRFTDHPDVVASLRNSFATMQALPCDILITAHPEVNDLWGRLARQAKQGKAAYVGNGACRALVDKAERMLASRLDLER